jgi:radial spoke head protein 9
MHPTESTTSDFTLGQMPSLSPEWTKVAEAITIPFRGEPSLPLMADGTSASPDEPSDESAPPPERFREMHRLAFTVERIDRDVAVLPRGAYVVDAAHNVVKNKAYGGMSFEASGALTSYYHFRPPMSARAIACLAKPGIVRPSDFLDPLTEDQPKGVWALAYDNTSTMAVLRNFYWTGYYFYHVIETADYGGAYFGDGLPNVDIAFML